MAKIAVYDRKHDMRVEATVDDCDVGLLAGRRWLLNDHGYVVCWGGGRSTLMHRVIMDAPKGIEVDHMNHDGLDNRRVNLRLVTHAQNAQNKWTTQKYAHHAFSSLYRGVYQESGYRGWVAEVRTGGRKYRVRGLQSELEAAAMAVELRKQHLPYSIEQPALAAS